MSRHSNTLDVRTANAAFNFIKEWEAFEGTVYADSNGAPHIGYGFALIIKGKGGKWEIRRDLQDAFQAARVTLKPADMGKLEEIRNTLNSGTAKEATALINGHSFPTINKTEGEQLTRFLLPEKVQLVQHIIGEDNYNRLDMERRLVLIDLAYLAPRQLHGLSAELKNHLGKGDLDKAADTLSRISGGAVRVEDDAEHFRDPYDPKKVRLTRDMWSMSHVAQRYGYKVNEILAANPGLDPTNLRPGQYIDLPDPKPRTRPTIPPPRGSQPSSGRQPATPAPPPLPGQRSGLRGGRDKTAAPDATAARAPSGAGLANTPAGRELLAAFSAEPAGSAAVDEALSKPVDQLTEGETDSLMNDPDYWRTTISRGQRLQNRVRAWHDHFYGTGPAPVDETGKMLPTRPIRPIPRVPTPPRTADGGDLVDSVLGVGKRVLTAAAEASLSEAVKSLQIGLNDTRLAADAGAIGLDGPALAVDGVFGPKTRRRLRGALAALGRAPVERSFTRSFAQFRPIGPGARPGSRV